MPTRIDIQRQLATDLALKKQLRAAGDDERQAHTIDHQFLADNEQSLIELSKVAPAIALKAGQINSIPGPDGRTRFTCDLQGK